VTVATFGEARAAAEQSLAAAGIVSARVDARWIVEHASGLSGSQLALVVRDPIPEGAAARVARMVELRAAGQPLQYVLGEWTFRGLDLYVDPRVLIPRPETELTVQVALDEAARLGTRRGRRNPWSGSDSSYAVADLGTGSGAIALALATELPDAAVWATDVSADALAVARANFAGAGSVAARVRVAKGDWFEALPGDLRGGLRMVVTNPPYIAEAEVDDLPPEVALHEPHLALVSGPTGLEAIERILGEAITWLEPGGAVVVELAPHQAEPGSVLARAAGFATVRVERDLTGRDRVLVAHLH
jgi:release factor glutamine methyltransferase